MGFTSDACWFLLIKTLLIKNNKKREAALKNEAGGDEKRVFFLLGLIRFRFSDKFYLVVPKHFFSGYKALHLLAQPKTRYELSYITLRL